MNNALILHGTAGNSKKNWFGWLKKELEQRNWNVWVPDLPESDRPSIKRYSQYILAREDWSFDSNTIIVGHSSGAVACLGLLEKLDTNVCVDTCYLIGAFKGTLGWEVLDDFYEKSFDFELIKKKAKRFVFIHSDDDPYCPLIHAEYLSKKLGGKLIVIPGQKHFSVSTAGTKYRRFPFLLKEILQ